MSQPNIGLLGRGGQEALTAYRKAIAEGRAFATKDTTNTPGFPAAPAPAGHVLNAFSLEEPAKLLYPVETPFRNSWPRRRPNVMSRVLQWKKITQINQGRAWTSVGYGQRGQVLTTDEVDVSAIFQTQGIESFVEREARVFAQDFQNLETLADLIALQAGMLGEEDLLMGGNTVALGTPTGTSATPGVGGNIAAATYDVHVHLVTLQGFRNAGQDNATYAALTLAQANAGLTDVLSFLGVVVAATGTIAMVLDDAPAAWGYAVFLEDQAAPGVFKSMGVFPSNTFTISDDPTPLTATAYDPTTFTDLTANALDFPGLLQQYVDPAAGAQVSSLDGAALTSDGAGGVAEITNAFELSFAASQRGPDAIWAGCGVRDAIRRLVAGSTAPVFRINLTDGERAVSGGMQVGDVLNQCTGQQVPIMTHPTMPDNIMFGLAMSNPYPHDELSAGALDVAVAEEWYREEFARTLRRTDFGVFLTEVLRVYFALSGFVIKNIG